MLLSGGRLGSIVLLGTSEIAGSKYNSLVPHVPYTVNCHDESSLYYKSSLVPCTFLGKKLLAVGSELQHNACIPHNSY